MMNKTELPGKNNANSGISPVCLMNPGWAGVVLPRYVLLSPRAFSHFFYKLPSWNSPSLKPVNWALCGWRRQVGVGELQAGWCLAWAGVRRCSAPGSTGPHLQAVSPTAPLGVPGLVRLSGMGYLQRKTHFKSFWPNWAFVARLVISQETTRMEKGVLRAWTT